MTVPSNAELRDKLVKLAEEWMESHEQAQFEAWADEAMQLFQAREQQLLTELLSHKVEVKTVRYNYDNGEKMIAGFTNSATIIPSGQVNTSSLAIAYEHKQELG